MPRVKTKVTIREKVSPRAKLIQKISGDKYEVQVGVFDGELARIGSYHEFGTGDIPQRSFIRAWFAQNHDHILTNLEHMMRKVYDGVSEVSELKRMGNWAVLGIRDRIRSKIPPRLAASTIQRKGHDIPLIDRGRLFRAISFKVKALSGDED